MDVAVIGSGVSGTFAAHALASRGASVTILDVGETLDAASPGRCRPAARRAAGALGGRRTSS